MWGIAVAIIIRSHQYCHQVLLTLRASSLLSPLNDASVGIVDIDASVDSVFSAFS